VARWIWRSGFHLLQPSKPLAGRSDSPLHKDAPHGNTGRFPLALYDWEARRPRHYGPNILQAQGGRSFYLKIKIWVHFSRRPGGVRAKIYSSRISLTRVLPKIKSALPTVRAMGNLAKLTPLPPIMRLTDGRGSKPATPGASQRQLNDVRQPLCGGLIGHILAACSTLIWETIRLITERLTLAVLAIWA
jgi:hypothetical protein